MTLKPGEIYWADLSYVDTGNLNIRGPKKILFLEFVNGRDGYPSCKVLYKEKVLIVPCRALWEINPGCPNNPYIPIYTK